MDTNTILTLIGTIIAILTFLYSVFIGQQRFQDWWKDSPSRKHVVKSVGRALIIFIFGCGSIALFYNKVIYPANIIVDWKLTDVKNASQPSSEIRQSDLIISNQKN